MTSQFTNALRWWAAAPAVTLLRMGQRMGGHYTLGRFACLGRDVCAQLPWIPPVHNVQKGRVDCLVEYIARPSSRPRTVAVRNHFARRDIVPLVLEQQLFALAARAPELILMDSFAELTDQKFVNRRRGWFFCANFTDLRHGEKFDAEYSGDGLLPIPALRDAYRRWFDHLRRAFPHTPIVFLHFPTKLDERVKFKERGAAILDSLSFLQREFDGLHSVCVDDGLVDWPAERGDEDFPYHFNVATYREMAAQISRIAAPGLEASKPREPA